MMMWLGVVPAWSVFEEPLMSRLVQIAVCVCFALLFVGVGCSSQGAHTVKLDIGPEVRRIAVDVENFNGDVKLRGDGRRGSATVDARVWAGIGMAEEIAPEVSVDVVYEVMDEDPTVAVVRVRGTSAREAEDHSLSIEVRLPRIDGVRVLNSGGTVEVVDASGEVHIENDRGGVEFRSSKPMAGDVLVLVTRGDIYYQVPEGSTGVLDVEAVEGSAAIKDEFGTLGDIRDDGQRVRATLGSGQNLVQLRTGDGRAWLTVMDEPVAYSRGTMWRPRIGWDSFMLEGSNRHKQNLPEDAYLPEDRGILEEGLDSP